MTTHHFKDIWKKRKLFPSPRTNCLYSSDFCGDRSGLGASEQSKHICSGRLLNYLAPNHLVPPREYFCQPHGLLMCMKHWLSDSTCLCATVGGVVVRVTSDIWTSCQPEPLVFAAPYWGSFTSDGEENIPRYWLSPKTSTSLGSHLMRSSVWTEERDGLLAYFAQAVCWLYCNWRQLQPGEARLHVALCIYILFCLLFQFDFVFSHWRR